MNKIIDRFEYLVILILIVMLMITIFFGTLLVPWSLIVDLIGGRDLATEPRELFDILGLFVAVLVGIELLKILRLYLVAHDVDTAIVVQTALIALCNKVITMNLSETSWTTLVALAALTLGLAAAILALRRSTP